MIYRTLAILLLAASICQAQHRWQKPKPLVPKADLEQRLGPLETTKPAQPRKILWVWGYDKPHAPGAHDYLKIRDLFQGLLTKVPDISVETVYLFPTKEQFASADLTVFFLHLPQLTDEQFGHFTTYIRKGGGVVSIHESAIIRPASEGKKLAQCLGMAWDEGRSQWGAIFEDITVKNEHEIFKGFPEKVTLMDEFYWDLNQEEGVDILGQVRTGPPRNSRAPVPPEKLSKDSSPMFWTYSIGEGRVFGTTTGHNTFSYYDPELRIILFRAMAWAMKENPDPFMPLVWEGITDDKGMVGTTELMRDWKGKLRGP